MYQEFFRLHESPFSLDPDPRFLYLSPAHATARAYLDYTVESRDGMVVLTGHAGCGKSILVADLCRRVDREDILLLEQTQLDPHELLQSLLIALEQDSTGDRPQMRARLREVLCERLNEGRRMTLIVDEAQHLSWESLEALRMIADQQDHGRRLLAVILVGQLGLARTLKTNGLEQLRQRVRLFYTLEPLPRQEIRRYIDHRLAVAGRDHAVVVSPRALQVIRRFTGGVPRLINTLMDMTLTAAALERTRMITARLVSESARELQWEPFYRRHARLFLSDRLRGVLDLARSAASHTDKLTSKLPRLRMPDLTALRSRAGQLTDQLPTQWLAGLGGAALVLLPAALLLPSWVAQVRLEQSIADAVATADNGDRTQFERVVDSTPPIRLPSVEAPPTAPASATRPAPNKAAVVRVEEAAPAPTEQKVISEQAQYEALVAARVAAAAAAAEASPAASPVVPGADEAVIPASTGPLKDARWLLQQPADAYSVQLFGAKSPAGIERFLADHGQDFRGDRELAAFTAERDGQPWHVLVLASYPTYAVTRDAIAQLPEPLHKHQPWVRRLEVIQATILSESSHAEADAAGDRINALVADAAGDPDAS